MRHFTAPFLCCALSTFAFRPAAAQVPATTVVEHTTNTVCGICASRNPGFYDNLEDHPHILHLAIHPSSPYSSCILNQHNTAENDARTDYYGIYGSTPKFVIQGELLPVSADLTDPAIFDPYEGGTSPASLSLRQWKYGADSVRVRVVVRTETAHGLGTLRLFVALAEDTIFYHAPNGEDLHFDVFREALTAPVGDDLILPATVGDSVVFTAATPSHPDWEVGRIFAIAILQEASDKHVIQAGALPAAANSAQEDTATTTGLSGPVFAARVGPIPAEDRLDIRFEGLAAGTAELRDLSGRLRRAVAFRGDFAIALGDLPSGFYVLQLRTDRGTKTLRVPVH